MLKGMTKKPEFSDDPVMFGAFLGCVKHAIGKAEMRDAFKADTGIDLSGLVPKTPLDAMIDEATGYRSAVMAKFCDWVAENVWGVEE